MKMDPDFRIQDLGFRLFDKSQIEGKQKQSKMDESPDEQELGRNRATHKRDPHMVGGKIPVCSSRNEKYA